ncbi:MAG: helicase [Circoviridae sp.]|nr:MAG: helicase [Circoviridae sp.]
MTSKSWKFTDFQLKKDFWKSIDCNRIAFSEEKCPSTGRLHLQGHVTFGRAYRLSQLKKLHPTCKWGMAIVEDWNYEIKELANGDGEVYMRDNRKKKGERTDLEDVKRMVVNGSSVREIASAHPGTFIRYGQGILRFMGTMVEPRDGTKEPEVIVIHGKTGTGKSRAARELCKGQNYYVWTPQRGKWFDGYYGQNYVIFEEFRGQIPLGFLLTLLDRYECPVETKGGMTEFIALKIFITSPLHPRDWYERCGDDDVWSQLNRRISEIIDADL